MYILVFYNKVLIIHQKNYFTKLLDDKYEWLINHINEIEYAKVNKVIPYTNIMSS